jgi:hypothetical protein
VYKKRAAVKASVTLLMSCIRAFNPCSGKFSIWGGLKALAKGVKSIAKFRD